MRLDVDTRDVMWATVCAVGLDVLLILAHPLSFCSGNGGAELRSLVLWTAGLVTSMVGAMAAHKVRWVSGRGQRVLVVLFALVAAGVFAVLLKIGLDIPVQGCA